MHESKKLTRKPVEIFMDVFHSHLAISAECEFVHNVHKYQVKFPILFP